MNKSNDNSSDIQRELQKLGYWDNIYSKNDYFGTGPTKLANTAYEILKKFSLKNILELGCGQGRDSIFFAKNNFNVTALDISENAIRYVENIKHQQNLDNLKLLTHNFYSLRAIVMYYVKISSIYRPNFCSLINNISRQFFFSC